MFLEAPLAKFGKSVTRNREHCDNGIFVTEFEARKCDISGIKLETTEICVNSMQGMMTPNNVLLESHVSETSFKRKKDFKDAKPENKKLKPDVPRKSENPNSKKAESKHENVSKPESTKSVPKASDKYTVEQMVEISKCSKEKKKAESL